jgi:hypothetical protein
MGFIQQTVASSTAYEDALLDPSTMRWFYKSNRTLESIDVKRFVEHRVVIHIVVKKTMLTAVITTTSARRGSLRPSRLARLATVCP